MGLVRGDDSSNGPSAAANTRFRGLLLLFAGGEEWCKYSVKQKKRKKNHTHGLSDSSPAAVSTL
jgi:hypothetical protein